MTLKYRELISNAGPDSNTGAWQPFVQQRLDLNDYSNGNQLPVFVAPQTSQYSTVNGNPIDFVSSSGYVSSISRLYLVSDADLAGGLTTDIFFSIYRAGSQVGAARIAGWASGASPAITALVPVAVPFYVTNTTALTGPPGKTLTTTQGIARLKPLDVLTFSASTKSQFGSANLFALVDVQ